MAPRPGLEPGTNGLTVRVTLIFHRSNLKNFKGIFDSNPPSHSRSETIPKFTYDSLAMIIPELMASVCPKASPGKELWQIEPRTEPELVPKYWRKLDFGHLGPMVILIVSVCCAA